MNKYFFFRTDRIGDFIFSSILLKSIKTNDSKANITVIASSKNYYYIKNQNYVDNVILYPERGFLNKINFIKDIVSQKIYLIAALDGKKRSIYACLLAKAKYKFLITTKIFFKIVFNIFFTKVLMDNDNTPKINETKNILEFLKFKLIDENYKFIKNKKFYFPNLDNCINTIKNDFIIFHLDEKWIKGQYINKYLNIEPSYKDLISSLNKIIEKKQKNILITSGNVNNNLITDIKSNFIMSSDKFYSKKINSNSIFYINELSFFELEYLIFKSSLLVSCHGAVTHIAAQMEKPIIDIIDYSKKDFYHKWSYHFKNHKIIFRDKFDSLSDKLINTI